MSLEQLLQQSTVTVERQVSSQDAGGAVVNVWSTHMSDVACRIEDASSQTQEHFARRQMHVSHELMTQRPGFTNGMRVKETFTGQSTALSQGAQTSTVTGSAVDMNGAPFVLTAAQTITAISGTSPTLAGAFSERGYDGTFTGDVTSGSTVVTGITTSGLAAGDAISGTGIPALTTIASVDSDSQITMSAAATATNAGVTITVVGTWSSVVGGTFTTVGRNATNLVQTITFQRTKRYLRYVGTITGTNPSYNVGVQIQPSRYYVVQGVVEERATGGIGYFATIALEEQRGRV